MRYYEFARQLNEDLDQNASRSLMDIITYEKSRIDAEDANPRISASRLITIMQNIGYESFNFKDLANAYADSQDLQQLISKPEKNQMIELLPDEETVSTDQGTDLTDMPPPETAIPSDQQMGGMQVGQPAQQPGLEEPISSEPSGPIESPQGTEQTVSAMSKKALKRRQ